MRLSERTRVKRFTQMCGGGFVTSCVHCDVMCSQAVPLYLKLFFRGSRTGTLGVILAGKAVRCELFAHFLSRRVRVSPSVAVVAGVQQAGHLQKA